eukprot:PITA_06246
MACVENINFSVIINGAPSPFFKAERGLTQGCPLSPLLFILVMNSFSILLNRAANGSGFQPLKMCKDFYLSHNLFVDDILVFAMLHEATWQCLHDIVSSLKYLGFSLKPSGYNRGDWTWLLDRFYFKISGWEARSLSLAGRFVLVQAVLSQLAIYWAHLFHIPASIIKKLKTYAAKFLWGGTSGHIKFHLAKMKSLTLPKNQGGWGLLDMRSMGNALLCKSLHRAIFSSSPWSDFIRYKYMKGRNLAYWYRRNLLGSKKGSAIWQSFRKILPFFMHNFRWSVCTGMNIFIGSDLLLNGISSTIPQPLVSYLHYRGIFTWNRLIKSWSLSSPSWMDAEDLSLPHHLCAAWNSLRDSLQGLPIKRMGDKDELVWSLPRAANPIRVKDIYTTLLLMEAQPTLPFFPLSFWKAPCPLKMILFSWLLFHNRNLSWDNLQKHGWIGPSRCALCFADGETNLHTFFQCHASKQIWYDLSLHLVFPHLCFSSVQEGFFWWSKQTVSRRSIFIPVCWSIWLWRNDSIFNGHKSTISSTLLRIKALLQFLGI